jgi:putative ABC transport system permease protein
VTRLRVLLARLLGTISGRRREDELREELETHLELLADEHRRRGLSDAEARLAARRELGGVAQTRERFRDMRILPGIDALRQDIRFAWRALMRDRGTTLAAIALLTIGVSSTVVLADVLDRLLLRPPTHVDDPARVRRLYAESDGKPGRLVTNVVTLARLTEGTQQEIEAIAPFMNQRIGTGRGAQAARFEAIAFGEAYFDVLGLVPRLGSLPSSRRPANPDAVVISHALWQQRFGAAPDVIGRSLRLGQRTYTIVAVGPRGFAGVDDDPVDVWVPLESRMVDPDWRTSPGYYSLMALARLRPGVDRSAAEAHASQVYNAVHHVQRMDGRRPTYRIILGNLPPAHAPNRSRDTNVLLAVAGMSSLVLLMACGNVGNLLVLTGLRRSSELALKTALGATRGRLAREVFFQAVQLAVIAGAAALVVLVTVGVLVRRVFLPPIAATVVGIDWRLAGITVVGCAAAALLLGLAPAIRLTAARAQTPGRTRSGSVPSRLVDAFVVFQVALAVPLLVGSGLFGVSFWKATHVDVAQEAGRVLRVSANFLDDGRPEDGHAAHRRIQARLASLPGVTSTALAQSSPMNGGYATYFDGPGLPPFNGEAPFLNAVDAEYFAVMGLQVVAGRAFGPTDNRTGARKVLVINEALARKHWPGTSPLGRCIRIQNTDPCAEIVGIVRARTMPMLDDTPTAMAGLILTPLELGSLSPTRTLLVRTSGNPRAILSRVQTEAQSAAGDLPYVDVSVLDDLFEWQMKPLRLGTSVFLALSGLAMVIAIAGLAVVTAHGVTRRTREMGIRLVLGAEPRDLVRLMARRTLVAMTVGLAAGAALAYAGAGLLRSVLFGIDPGDPRIFAAATAVLLFVGGLAAWIPARRTGRIEPSAALRIE